MIARFVAFFLMGMLIAPLSAQTLLPATTLFQNVRIFDGQSGRVTGPSDVLVRGNHIERIAVNQPSEPGAMLIKGQGRTLMPGLIDMHWHSMLASPPLAVAMSADENYLALLAGIEAERTLMRGFTTVRDVGGPAFGLKRAIDERRLPGPRIFPSGPMISVTSGHGDFRSEHDLPRTLGEPGSRFDRMGYSAIADSADEVRLRTREQLLRGASQIKLSAGGGVASPHSPLDAITFTEAELRAAVEAAKNWGTYVTVHAYTSESIRQAIAAGVQCIEHAMLMDDATAQLMASNGIWLSTQPLPLELGNTFAAGSEERAKFQQVYDGVDNVYKLARKYKIKTAFGTDVLFSSSLATQQGALLASLTRWYPPAELLTMATGTNAQLLSMSGKRNPYPGKLGIVEEGAIADLLLVDGNPIEDINLIADPDKNIVLIMKDGEIYKNTIPK
ncbi:MAG: amidohydrolase family protein [Aeromonas popoffii]|uniref:metal-dependent hydrolase family protein n=1 Tax=Aeromonas popoffii TaxID=70856 RepID=UPI003F2CFCAD